jgi:hypothetical protein
MVKRENYLKRKHYDSYARHNHRTHGRIEECELVDWSPSSFINNPKRHLKMASVGRDMWCAYARDVDQIFNVYNF